MLKPSQRTENPLPSAKALYGRVFQIAWPSLAESFFVAIIGMVDTIMVSTLGTYAISAVGLTTQPRMLVLCMFMAMSVGVTAVCARRLGQQNRESAQKCLRQMLLIAAVLSSIACLIIFIFAPNVMLFAGAQPDTLEASTTYFRILLIGMPFNIITIIINAAQRGVGQTKVTLKTNLIANGVNVVFNYLLIGGNLGFPRLEVAGAAIATSLGYTVAAAVALISVRKKSCYVFLSFKKSFLPDRETMQAVFKVSSSAMLEQLFMRFGFFSFAKIVAGLGTVDFATHQIALNILHISFSFGDGLSAASSALIGRSLGEKRPDMAVLYGKGCQRIGAICSVLVAFVCIVFGRQLVMIFSQDPEIIERGRILQYFAAVITTVQISAVVYAGSLRSAGDTLYVSIMAMVCIGILRPFLGNLLCNTLGFGLFGAWTAMTMDQVARTIFLGVRFATGKWTKIEV